MNKDNIYCL